MSPADIQSEFDQHGRLSRRAVDDLRDGLVSDDPYSAITVAVDTACFELSDQIAQCLSSDDPMVRWNAAAGLFTRFRDPKYAALCLKVVRSEQDEQVRDVSVVGLGELLPRVDDEGLRREMAATVLSLFKDVNVLPETRGAAYEAILAATDVLPLDRPQVTTLSQLDKCVDPKTVAGFQSRFNV